MPMIIYFFTLLSLCLPLSVKADPSFLVGGYTSGYKDSAYENFIRGKSDQGVPPYDTVPLIKAGEAQDSLMTGSFELAKPLISQNIVNLLTNISESQSQVNIVKSSQPVLDITAENQQSTVFFSFDNLLLPTQYKTEKNPNGQEAAENYVKLAGGLAVLPKAIVFSTINKGSAKDEDVAKYLGTLWTYISQLSASFSTLYHYYAERIPLTDSDIAKALQNAGMRPTPTTLAELPKSASILQIEQYLATRRLKDAKWFNQINQADPVALNREQLFLQAEMRAEEFKQRMETERTNALLAILIAQNAAAGRNMMLTDTDRSKAQTAIAKASEKKNR